MVHISYKLSINYCAIKTQIVIILSKTLNTALSISTFSEHITIFRTLSIDIWHFKSQKPTKQNGGSGLIEFICLFIICRTIKFFFLNLMREATLESKAVPTISHSSEFLLNSVFNFITHIFGNKFSQPKYKQCYWNNQLFCWPAVKKWLRSLCVWTLKILYSNKWILTQ